MKKNPKNGSLHGWTEERRKKQAEAIRHWKPWEKSTGPKSDAGKNTVKDNALKHGLRSEDGIELRRLLTIQKQFVKTVMQQRKSK